MNQITAIETGCKENIAEERREYLLAALRAGSLRARLAAAELDQIGLALKHGMISPEVAISWIEYEFDVRGWCLSVEVAA